jgi:hypothetical protein
MEVDMSHSLEQPVISEKKTIELCNAQGRRGTRCVLPRGHEGEHEHQEPDGGIVRSLAR